MSRHFTFALALALAAALAAALAGCAGERAPSRASDPAIRSQALIDSANAAFRGGDYDGAARRYASAAAVAPRDPAAWYGLGMALARLKRDEEAREAYARARALLGRAPDTSAAAR